MAKARSRGRGAGPPGPPSTGCSDAACSSCGLIQAVSDSDRHVTLRLLRRLGRRIRVRLSPTLELDSDAREVDSDSDFPVDCGVGYHIASLQVEGQSALTPLG